MDWGWDTFGPMEIDDDDEDITMAHETLGPMEIDDDKDDVIRYPCRRPVLDCCHVQRSELTDSAFGPMDLKPCI